MIGECRSNELAMSAVFPSLVGDGVPDVPHRVTQRVTGRSTGTNKLRHAFADRYSSCGASNVARAFRTGADARAPKSRRITYSLGTMTRRPASHCVASTTKQWTGTPGSLPGCKVGYPTGIVGVVPGCIISCHDERNLVGSIITVIGGKIRVIIIPDPIPETE